MGTPHGLLQPSIDAPRKLMQRGGRTQNQWKYDSAVAFREGRRAQVLELCGECSSGGSNARSGPVAATEEGAGAFQRNRAGESDTLVVRCIPGSEIREKTVPTRKEQKEQEETQRTSRGQSIYCKPWNAGMGAACTGVSEAFCASKLFLATQGEVDYKGRRALPTE